MKFLDLKKFSQRELLIVGLLIGLVLAYGVSTSFVSIQNTTTVNYDYYTTVVNSDGSIYTWTKNEGIPTEFDNAVLSGTVELSVTFTSGGDTVLSVYLVVDGPTPGSFYFRRSTVDANVWVYSLDTTQLDNGEYVFTFNMMLDNEDVVALSSFRMNFYDGTGDADEVSSFPVDLVIVFVIIGAVVLFGGSRTRRG